MPLVALQGETSQNPALRSEAVKTYRNLYEKLYDFDTLYRAYLEARRSKRYRDEVLAFTANLEENLIDIQNHLIYQTYKVGRYKEFYVRDPKKRLIMALPFRDRVVQWALYSIVNPIFTRSYIDTSYGCVEGRGSVNAIKKLQYWLRLPEIRKAPCYALKMDITKFFFRIPHDVQLRVLRERIADERVMWLFDLIINSDATPFGFPLEVADVEYAERLFDVGMPVGNLISQMLANIVMNKVDQYIKRDLRMKYYMRYMDDMLILGHDKQRLHEVKELVERYLEDNLGLTLNRKTSVRPVACGIDFVGFRVWNNDIRMRKSSALRMKHRLRSIREKYGRGTIPLEKCLEVIVSYLGIMKHFNSDNLRDKILEDFVLVRRWPPEDKTE